MDITEALLQEARDSRKALETLSRDLASLRERSARERERSANRFSLIERTMREMQAQLAKPTEFTFSHLWNHFWLKVGFGVGMTLASLKLPEEAAAQLIKLAALLAG